MSSEPRSSRASLWIGIAVGVLAVAAASFGFLLKYKQEADEQDAEFLSVMEEDEEKEAQAFVDEDYRFRLEVPGPGWKLLGREALLGINPDALAGAVRIEEDHENWALVLVDEAPGVDVELWARRVPEDLGLLEAKISQVERVDFQGHPAARLAASGIFNGKPMGLTGVVFARGDIVFSVLAYDMPHAGDDSHNQAAIAAFKTLPGDIAPRPPHATPDGSGIGWRIRSGVFESAAYRLRMKPHASCRVDGGKDAHGDANHTELILLCKNPQLWVKITPYHAPGANEGKLLAQLASDMREGMTAIVPELATNVAGRAMRMQRLLDEREDELLSGGVRLEGDIYLSIVAGYFPTLREKVDAALAGVLAGVEPMSDADTAASAADSASAAVPAQIGEALAYRSNVFVEFDYGVAWQRPAEGSWRVRAGDAALLSSEGAIFWVKEPTIDLTAYLFVDEEATDPRKHFDDQRGALAPLDGVDIDWGGAQVSVARGEWGDGLRLRSEHWAATAVVDGTGYTVTVDYPAASRDTARDKAITVINAFELTGGPVAYVGRPPGAYRDLRMGFQLPLPAAATAIEESNEPDTVQLVFEGDNEVVGIAAVALGEGDTDALHGIVVQTMKAKLKTRATSAPIDTPSTIGGKPARRIRYGVSSNTVFDLHHFVDEHILYALLISGTAARADALASQFQLLPLTMPPPVP